MKTIDGFKKLYKALTGNEYPDSLDTTSDILNRTAEEVEQNGSIDQLWLPGTGENAVMTKGIEGYRNAASGKGSTAEGGGTKASSPFQHVQGRFNVEDTNNTYAHIVGGGSDEEHRANIHTLDWNGNAVYEGTMTCKNSITIGSITVTEAQLTALLALLNG